MKVLKGKLSKYKVNRVNIRNTSYLCTINRFGKMSTKGRTLTDKELEEESLLSPCFQLDQSVEIKDVPTNGEEYLMKVINERRNYLVVTRCNKDVSKFAKNQSRFIEELPATHTAPEGLKPTVEWQNIQVADFSEIRLYVSRKYSNKKAWPKTVKKILIDPKDIVLWKCFFNNYSPTLSCLFGLKQSYLDLGLSVLVKSLMKIKPGETIDEKTGKWIYGFLAYIPLPLLPDTVSLLRSLARRCAEIRSHIKLEDGVEQATLAAAPLNLFISLVSRYFRQWDLADK